MSGLKVRPIAANRMQMRFSGTKVQVEAAFHTEIHLFNVKGEKHFANVGVPEVPAAVAPLISGDSGSTRLLPEIDAARNGASRPRHFQLTDGGGMQLRRSRRFRRDLQPESAVPGWTQRRRGHHRHSRCKRHQSAIANTYWQALESPRHRFNPIPVPGGPDPGLTHTGPRTRRIWMSRSPGGLAPGANILLVRDKNVLLAVQYVIENNLGGDPQPVIRRLRGGFIQHQLCTRQISTRKQRVKALR